MLCEGLRAFPYPELCLFIYLWSHCSACGISDPWSGINPHPQHWEYRVLITRPLAKFSVFILSSVLKWWLNFAFNLKVVILNIGYLVDSFFFQHFEFLISLTSGLHCFMDVHIYVSIYFSLAAFRFSVCSSVVWLCLNIHLFTFVLRGISWAFDE